MGTQNQQQPLFSFNVNLDKRVRNNHPLRAVKQLVDFGFVRKQVSSLYGYNGNESVDPVVIMKMMFLLFFDNVASERELMNVIAERLDYLWFLGYGLDDEIPDHSVLSKARKKWGTKIFEELFTRIVWQCVESGLVNGEKIHLDGSLIDANASKNSIKRSSPEVIAALRKTYQGTETKLSECDTHEESEDKQYYQKINNQLLSTTDPDAAIVRKGRLEARPRYKNHRVVDDARGVITAIATTSGDADENHKAFDLVEQHERNTDLVVRTVVGDTQYGTVANMITCAEKNIECHFADMSKSQAHVSSREGIYPESSFKYSKETNTYTCPAGATLIRRKNKLKRNAYEYSADRKICAACTLRTQCTRAATGTVRTVKRHYKHELLEIARRQSASRETRADLVRRKWLMEGSFADAANNHGFKRARWRRLFNQQIQDYFIAAVQNIRILIKQGHDGIAIATSGVVATVQNVATAIQRYCGRNAIVGDIL